ncbi:MAG: DUF799 family lipoprotein [Nitrospinaceae bacterium]|nr:DUF799 family lipoprotein [Nitrospinaceae bacterium]
MERPIVSPDRIYSFAKRCIVLVGILLAGCGTVDLEIRQNHTNPSMQPRSVAILPFTLQEPDLEKISPHKLFRTCFYNYFSYLGYVDLPLETIDKKLQQAGFTDPKKISALSHEKLREILNVDAIVRANVLSVNNFTGGIHAETAIKAKIEMLDLRTGDILWDTEHREMTYSGILSPTLVEIIQDQIDNVKVHQAYLKTAELFSINMMRKIPDPADNWKGEIRLPEITQIETNLKPNLKLKPNDRIYVNLKGDPGLTGYFDIGSWKSNIPLKEIVPGLYSGSYTINAADKVTSSLIIGTLRNKNGLTGKKFYKEGMAQFDASTTH